MRVSIPDSLEEIMVIPALRIEFSKQMRNPKNAQADGSMAFTLVNGEDKYTIKTIPSIKPK